MRTNVPSAIRELRRRRRWRQVDLGARAGLSRDAVSRAERGRLDGLTVASVSRLAEALGAALVVEVRWHGADLDRLIDRRHAALVEATATRLTSAGWLIQAEVSFNHYGDRGSCDLVAWHPATRTILVVEAKSRLGNVQDALYRLDVKRRLAPVIAAQLGWPMPDSVARFLVLADDRANRRVVARNAGAFAAFGTRGWEAGRWLKRPPGGAASLLLFLPDSDEGRTNARDRVRGRRGAG